MPRDEITILDIVHAAKLATEFAADSGDREGFLQDRKTQAAVLHQLMIVGEAVKRLSADFRAAHGDTPWMLIAGMRDKLIHAYDEVDLEEVWRTMERDIPDLLKDLEPLVTDDDA